MIGEGDVLEFEIWDLWGNEHQSQFENFENVEGTKRPWKLLAMSYMDTTLSDKVRTVIIR